MYLLFFNQNCTVLENVILNIDNNYSIIELLGVGKIWT